MDERPAKAAPRSPRRSRARDLQRLLIVVILLDPFVEGRLGGRDRVAAALRSSRPK